MFNVQTDYFHRLSIGQKFRTHLDGQIFTKTSKGGTEFDNGAPYRINSQKIVIVVDAPDQAEPEVSWEELDFHTFDFTPKQAADVIEQIVDRAVRQYGADRIDADRLRKGVYCAHRTKPARLIALLNTCNVDFPREILYGVYRHYDEATDTLRNGWTLQHSEPHVDPWAWLFGSDDDE
jgi:hypothetical protein